MNATMKQRVATSNTKRQHAQDVANRQAERAKRKAKQERESERERIIRRLEAIARDARHYAVTREPEPPPHRRIAHEELEDTTPHASIADRVYPLVKPAHVPHDCTMTATCPGQQRQTAPCNAYTRKPTPAPTAQPRFRPIDKHFATLPERTRKGTYPEIRRGSYTAFGVFEEL